MANGRNKPENKILGGDPKDPMFISAQDSLNLDAFEKIKVSFPFTQFDSKQLNTNSLEIINFVSQSITGATAIFSTARSSTVLAVSASSGSNCIRQTRKRMNYQPEKGLSIFQTFILGTGSSGVIKRIGYFDENNGIFFEQNQFDLNMVVRSNVSGAPIDTRISQSNWNINKFDGNVTENISTLNVSTTQILFIDFQWLGGGTVRTGFFQDGNLNFAHKFHFANSASSVYMTNPNLPARCEILNNSNSSTNSIETICVSVQSDGGYDPASLKRSVDTGTTAKAITANILKPLLSIKLTSSSKGDVVTPTDYTFFATTTDSFRWGIFLNPIYSGSDLPVWNPVSASSVFFDVTRSATIVGGILLDSGYGAGGAARIPVDEQLIANFNLGFSVNGTSDEIVLAAAPLANASLLAQLGWKES